MNKFNKRCCMLLVILMTAFIFASAVPAVTQAAGVKLKMYNVWGIGCPPCVGELPHLGEISRNYQGVVAVIGLQTDGVYPDRLEQGNALLAENNCSYPNLPLTEEYVWMVQFEEEGGFFIPQMHFVNQNNKIVKSVIGANDYEGWAAIIEALLADMKDDTGLVPGDLDNDGDVDLYDLQNLVEYLVSRKEPASLANADVNQSGKVDEEDAEALIALILAQ